MISLRWAPTTINSAASFGVPTEALAAELLGEGALGVVYPSVRRPSGTCIACFRPAILANVRRSGRYEFRWEGKHEPIIRAL